MKIIETTQRSSSLIHQLLDIWEHSVQETHLFLSASEIQQIKNYVPEALKNVAHLIIATNDENHPVGFMGIEENKLEMLFITPTERGKGLGKKLIQYGIQHYALNTLTVNEQNPQAVGFYEHMGFSTYQRTPLDEQGNPYPLLYMKLKTSA